MKAFPKKAPAGKPRIIFRYFYDFFLFLRRSGPKIQGVIKAREAMTDGKRME